MCFTIITKTSNNNIILTVNKCKTRKQPQQPLMRRILLKLPAFARGTFGPGMVFNLGDVEKGETRNCIVQLYSSHSIEYRHHTLLIFESRY